MLLGIDVSVELVGFLCECELRNIYADLEVDVGVPLVCQDDGFYELAGLLLRDFRCRRVDVAGALIYMKHLTCVVTNSINHTFVGLTDHNSFNHFSCDTVKGLATGFGGVDRNIFLDTSTSEGYRG